MRRSLFEISVKLVYRYLFNNRKGIANALTLGLDRRSCAEGLVSHTLSERLSSNCAKGSLSIAIKNSLKERGYSLKKST